MQTTEALTRQRPRFGFIDLAKGLMLIEIIITHTQGYFIAYPIDNFAIVVFFICSGFTSKPDFSLSRIFRKLMIPYIIMNLICVAYISMVSPHSITAQSLLGILYSRSFIFNGAEGADRMMMLTLCNAVLWFTTAMMSAYCIFRLILLCRSTAARAVASLVSILIACLAQRLPVLLPWSIDTAFFLAPYMWIGQEIRARGLLDRMSWKVFLLLAAIYVATYFPAGHTNYSIRVYGDSFVAGAICALSGAIAFMWLCIRLDRFRPLQIIKKMNRQAMYIFGLQIVFIDIAHGISNRFHLPVAAEVVLGIVLACVGGYFAGEVLTRLLPEAASRVRTFLKA